MSKKSITYSSQLLDVHKAAEYLSVSVGTIRRWAHTKQLKGTKVGIRGDWRFTTDELLKMSKANHNAHLKNENLDTSASRLLDTLPFYKKTIEESEHFVQFYERDNFLLDSLSNYIRIGLSRGDVCIVVSTKIHRLSLEKHLKKHGLDLATAKRRGEYISFDAAETLEKFMVNGSPNPKLFFEFMGAIIKSAARTGQHVRIFGEMVALLWEEGNESAAIHLEKIWNDISTIHSFSLFCAYPIHSFGQINHMAPFTKITSQHARIIPAESYSTLANSQERIRAISQLQQKAEVLKTAIKQLKKN